MGSLGVREGSCQTPSQRVTERRQAAPTVTLTVTTPQPYQEIADLLMFPN